LAMTDMQGRLQGKRLDAEAFVREIAAHGAEACNYLLAVDVEMNTLPGFALTSWESGYGDFVLQPDLSSLRPMPWLEGTVLCLADVMHHDGSPVVESPRQILRAQLDRLGERGWNAKIGSELEFVLFRESYDSAREKGYRDLKPANAYNVDYSILGTTMVEDVIRPIRLAMKQSGLAVEDSKGECNLGQHEINFRYQDALRMADDHVFYKLAAKEIAYQHGAAITFMAKVNQLEGNSCHIHCSFWEGDEALFPGTGEGGHSAIYDQYIAGQVERTHELSFFFAPNINSYKRYAYGSFAPTTLLWGRDNRTAAFRSVGHGKGLRLETRIAGGDANPYLAFAAIVAAGLDGVDRGLVPPPPTEGSAYDADGQRMPTTLAEAVGLLDQSAFARAAFGDRVIDHYVNSGRHEVMAFDAAVTDWELVRSFERS
ncbi:MAG: glutamine synthetase family protein, partial [Gaiellales bacterium]